MRPQKLKPIAKIQGNLLLPKIQEKESIEIDQKLKNLQQKMAIEKEQREQEMKSSGTRWKQQPNLPKQNINMNQSKPPIIQKQLLKPLPLQNNQFNFAKKQLNQSFHITTTISSYQNKNEKATTLKQFLNDMGLQQYYQLFQENGIISVQKLQSLKMDDLKKIGLLPGHIIKLLKTVTQIKIDQSNQKSTNSLRYQESATKFLNSTQSTKRSTSYVNLKTETFNQQTDNNMCMLIKKESCYGCYKLIGKQKDIIKEFGHSFCSTQCVNIYKQEDLLTCQVCEKIFLTLEGIKINNEYYCSQKCKPQIEDLIIRWESELNEDRDLNFNIMSEYDSYQYDFIQNKSMYQMVDDKLEQKYLLLNQQEEEEKLY